MRMYTGPGRLTAARTALAVSQPSAGTMRVMLASERRMAMSSVQWWVVPACPKLTPPCVAMILTSRFW